MPAERVAMHQAREIIHLKFSACVPTREIAWRLGIAALPLLSRLALSFSSVVAKTLNGRGRSRLRFCNADAARLGAYATARRIALFHCDVSMVHRSILRTTEATMKVGQRVRFKSTSSAARYWKIPHDAQGTVMCSYQLLTSYRATADRLDVRFTPQIVIWGGAAEDFEEIRDIPERTMQ